MTPQRPLVATVAFSPVARDARVLRQARYLARRYDVVVLGHGPAGSVNVPGVRFQPIEVTKPPSSARRTAAALKLTAGRIVPRVGYESLYWSYAMVRSAREALAATGARAILANDWLTLPLAARAAAAGGVPFALDLHEYAPRQHDDQRAWRWLRQPMVDYVLRTYARGAAATFTVNGSLARTYAQEYGLDPVVILNAPESVALPPFRETAARAIRIVHHGLARRARRLEVMLEAVARAGERYRLDLLLVPGDPGYVEELEAYAERLAPGRIVFHPPVPPDDIVMRLSGYDIGLFVLPPTNFNYANALPNKLFDFINAGLAVCVGPTSEMARIVEEHDLGVVAPSFAPGAAAETLRRLSVGEIDRLKRRSRQAAATLNADTEGAKLLGAFEAVLP